MAAGAAAEGGGAEGGGKARHLLHVFSTFDPGGPQVRCADLWQLCPREWRHTVVAMDGRTGTMDRLGEDLSVELVAAPRGNFLANRKAFRSLVRELRPDLLLTYNWGAIEAVAGGRSAGVCPLVHHEEGFLTDELLKRHRRRNWMRRAMLRGLKTGLDVVVPSALLAGIAQREWGVPKRRLHLLPNGADLERFVPRSGERAAGPLRIGCVGGLRPEKGHARLLRAAAALPMEPAWEVHLVGDGVTRPELECLARELGIGSRVRFLGLVADPADAYRSFDVFALPSDTEQMPLVLLEAMATGLAVVSTDVGDVARILGGAGGASVPLGDDAGFTRALGERLQDAALRRDEGAALRAHVAAHYELRGCLGAYRELYGSRMGS